MKLLSLYPAPTGSGLAYNFFYTPKQPQTLNIFDVRIDHNFNPNNIIFGVYDWSTLDVTVPSSLPGLAVGQGGGRNDSLPAYMVAGGYTHIFNATLTNEMHFGYTALRLIPALVLRQHLRHPRAVRHQWHSAGRRKRWHPAHHHQRAQAARRRQLHANHPDRL